MYLPFGRAASLELGDDACRALEQGCFHRRHRCAEVKVRDSSCQTHLGVDLPTLVFYDFVKDICHYTYEFMVTKRRKASSARPLSREVRAVAMASSSDICGSRVLSAKAALAITQSA